MKHEDELEQESDCTETEDVETLFRELLQNDRVRWAYKENGIRRELARAFGDARARRGLSVRELAKQLQTSSSQVNRLLHIEAGGSLTLSTLCRAADTLGLRIGVHVWDDYIGRATGVATLGTMAWTPSTSQQLREEVVAPPTAVSATGDSEWATAAPAQALELAG